MCVYFSHQSYLLHHVCFSLSAFLRLSRCGFYGNAAGLGVQFPSRLQLRHSLGCWAGANSAAGTGCLCIRAASYTKSNPKDLPSPSPGGEKMKHQQVTGLSLDLTVPSPPGFAAPQGSTVGLGRRGAPEKRVSIK